MTTEEMFTTSGRDRRGFADFGAPAKPYCRALPPMSHAPADWVWFLAFIKGRGLDPHLAKLNAWYPSWEAGDKWLRAVIPGTSRDPANQYWQGRLIEDTLAPPPTTPSIPGEGPGVPKRYQSPHAARGDALIVTHPDYHDIPWDVDNAHPPPGTVLVEGPFDALAASELGFVGVALMGNTPGDEILDHAVSWLKAGPPAVLVADGDAIVPWADLVWRLLIHHSLPSLRTLSPYPYKDLAEMPKQERRRMFRDGGVKV